LSSLSVETQGKISDYIKGGIDEGKVFNNDKTSPLDRKFIIGKPADYYFELTQLMKKWEVGKQQAKSEDVDILNEFEARNKASSEKACNSSPSSFGLEIELISGGKKGKMIIAYNMPMCYIIMLEQDFPKVS